MGQGRCLAQAPGFRWASGHGGASEDFGRGVALDGRGHIYLAGHFVAPAEIGGIALAGVGDRSQDVFVAKFDSRGAASWAVRAGGNGFDECGQIAADSAGNSYLAGHFQGNAQFGDLSVASRGQSDFFLSKLDVEGRFSWTVSGGGVNGDAANGVAVDIEGNVYITGSFQETVDWSGSILKAAGGRDLFLSKYNSRGNHLWTKSAGGSGSDEGWSVAVERSGQCYVTGEFSGSVRFGEQTLTSRGAGDVFVVKCDPSGNVLWAVRAGGDDSRLADVGRGIAVDRRGDCYVTGLFHGRADFGGMTLSSIGYRDIFVAKFDASGTPLWAARAGGSDGDEGHAIAVDHLGNAYVTGFYYGITGFGNTMLSSPGHADVFVARYSPRGVLEWVAGAEGTAYASGHGIAVDEFGSVYATGYFRGTTTFGGLPVGYRGDRDAFLFRIDGPPLAPELRIRKSGGRVTILWPTNQSGFVLESTRNLTEPRMWNGATEASTIVENQNSVSLTAPEPEAARFYRLRRR